MAFTFGRYCKTSHRSSTRTNIHQGSNIRVDEEDLDVLGLTSIAVSNGGYVSQLGVFHELHCLVTLPRTLQSVIFAKK